MAITSYAALASAGANSTSTKPVPFQDWTVNPGAGVAASSVAILDPTVSTTVPPGVVYRRWTASASGPGAEGEGEREVAAAGVLGAAAGLAGAVRAALVELAAEAEALADGSGPTLGPRDPAAAVVASWTGQAAMSATCGPPVAVDRTESRPAHTTAVAVAVAAAQARTAYSARFDTPAALLPGSRRRRGRRAAVHWLSAVNPLGCHTMARVLLVEDDPDIRTTVIRQLSEFGHSVRSAGTALTALREATRDPGDVIVLDLGLPDLDGSEALKMLRAVTRTPVIIATARDDEAEIIRLLHAGADDYLVKPYSSAHLAARIAAVLRRSGVGALPTALRVGGLEIDPRRRQATLDGGKLDLSRREFDLLAYLAARPGEVVTRRELLSEVWQLPYGDDQTIDVHLSWLRRKLGERASRPRYLHTVRGVGVRLVEPVDSAATEPSS